MRIIVGISGASGAVLGYDFLRALRSQPNMEIHLVITEGAIRTFDLETNFEMKEVYALADFVHDCHNMAASISSGSFVTDGMVVVPCSMKTLSGIVHGYSSNLLLRAADVCLKENRKVILVPREMPLSKIHLKNLQEASFFGCTIIPPMLTFYNESLTIEKQINHIIGKIMMQFGLKNNNFVPWQEPVF